MRITVEISISDEQVAAFARYLKQPDITPEDVGSYIAVVVSAAIDDIEKHGSLVEWIH